MTTYGFTNPPVIVKQPVSQRVVLNSNVVLSVTASDAPGYQWRFNGQNLLGSVSSSLAISSMQAGNVGGYSVVVKNPVGAVTSAVATVDLAVPPGFLWARRTTNEVDGYIGISSANHLAIDAAGNVFVAGFYGNHAGVDFGGAILTNNSVTDGGGTFVCRYDQWGNFLWARRISSTFYDDRGMKVATGSAGDLYVVGDYSGTATFGTNVLTAAAGAREMFVAKYDGQGTALWARRM